MAVKDRDPFVAIPATLNAMTHKDYRSSYLEVYVAICSRVGTSPAQDHFCTCFPSIATIAEKFKHSRTTVIEATAWLEKNGYLFRERQRQASNLYTIILRRDWFLQMRQAEGEDAAKEKYKAWLKEQQSIARRKRPDESSGSASSSSGTQQSSDCDFKSNRSGQEVSLTDTSQTTTKKSQPLDLDLDPFKTRTRSNRPDDLEPQLPLGPFSRRKIFD